MGNNGSNSRERGEQQIASETSRGWSQSFPRELARHRGQPSAVRKVLPDPPNQRLRATDNGNIIHNGGTISGRRPTLSFSRDLAKVKSENVSSVAPDATTCILTDPRGLPPLRFQRNEPPPLPLPPSSSSSSSFRERSGSTSNLVESRSRRSDRRCCRYRTDSVNSSSGVKLKRFDSEPDLRCSPEPAACPSSTQDQIGPADRPIPLKEDISWHRVHRVHGRESKERLESSRYKPKKKYKAPAPPTSSTAPSTSAVQSADRREHTPATGELRSCLTDEHHRHHHRHRQQHQQLQPPPRRSRLFKTRAESKKAQVSWQLSSGREPSRASEQQEPGPCPESATLVDATANHYHHRQHRAKLPDRGKNTLQRSMSSPEFQAELIEMAKRVRDKLESSGNLGIGDTAQARRTDRSDGPDVTVGHVRVRYRNDEAEDSGRKSQKVDRPRKDLEVDAAGGADRRRRLRDNENEKRNSVAECLPTENRFCGRDATDKENSDPGRWNEQSRRKWPDVVVSTTENPDARPRSIHERVDDGINNLLFVDRVEREDRQAARPFTPTAATAATATAAATAHSSTPKTFYFGMNECSNSEIRNDGDRDAGREFEMKSRFREREAGRSSMEPTDDVDDNGKSVVENISLKLRPTLPKKQLEIPRFSPSAAWRLLSALETPGPSMSTASEEMPVMFEERIERLSRPPPAFPVPLGPRSWHDKSGDSGISGDAGAANEDSLDVSTINRMKTTAIRPSWTPQQDLGEESSSDAGVDSPPPPPLPTPFKYHPPRAHVFSLSLPRDDARAYLCGADTKPREGSTFNSLQKLKRSVSGAFGIGSHDSQRKCTRDVIDDNWLLSSSAPTSLQHNPVRGDATRLSPSAWRPFSVHDSVDRREQGVVNDEDDDVDDDDDDDDDVGVDDGDDGDDDDDDDGDDGDDDDEDGDDGDDDDDDDDGDGDGDDDGDDGDDDDDDDDDGDDEREEEVNNLAREEDEEKCARKIDSGIREDGEETNDFPAIMKPPSFSYLTSGGHVMYLPETNETEHRVKNFSGRKVVSKGYEGTTATNRERNASKQVGYRTRLDADGYDNGDDGDRDDSDGGDDYGYDDDDNDDNDDNEEDEDAAEGVTKKRCNKLLPSGVESRKKVDQRIPLPETKLSAKRSSKSKRFTFQSTVRQIERRRLAEKLSREVEARERQRKGELEAMRKVEEEFQRKRAKEKANIRQQLRLFKEMEDLKNLNNGISAGEWDASQTSRADPDGAPSSAASSPTSLPPGSLSTPAGKCSPDGPEFRRKKHHESNSEQRHRPKYYDWSPDTSSHLDHKQTTVHPKIVCDIPKSSPVFVDVNAHPGNSAPRSDNYRKDFAHGTVIPRTSFASSDSELSQPNTRPHSRQTGVKVKSHRSRRTEFEGLISESSDEEGTGPMPLARGPRSKQGEHEEHGEREFELPIPAAGVFEEDTDEIILSVIWNNNHLGAAYYNIVTSELFVMEDTMDDAEHFDTTRALYRQCWPRYVVTNAGAPAVFRNAVKKILTSETTSNEGANSVRCLRLESEPRNASNADRLTFLNSVLNFKCYAMIHALGSLLLFVDKHWNDIALDSSGKPYFVSLNYITLHDMVTMDEDTYKALNIVQAKDHPSLFKFGKTVTRAKGVSLFSLMNRYCHSRPGVQFLWKTLHHPTRNLTLLEHRFDAIEFFLHPDNQGVMENLSLWLRHVYRLTNTVLACCSGPQAKASNWYKVHKTIARLICIADVCEEYADRLELFKRIAESVTKEMLYVKYFIEYIVDFGESRRERRLVVRSNVDPLLDELDHVRRTLPQLLTEMGEKDMREHLPPSVTGCNMLYLPNIGYVLAINKWNPTPPEDVALPNLEFKFSINQVHYYKSSSAKELDETVGDIVLKIAVRQNHIVQKLIRYTRKHTGQILHAIHLCAELDTLLAFSKVARDYNYVRPNVTESKMLDVVEGRHPLMECVTTFVPNDISSGNGTDNSFVKVLMGPNSCGKSVYLKQIGLLVFMAHIGSYVPAKSARIGRVSRILTQMTNTESIALNASSFLQNLRQINVALRASTSDSIVITDELDRGTSEVSGFSLVAAVLNTFVEKGADCPHVFAATHAYTVLPFLHRSPLIEFQTFEYTINEDESLVFLYRLTNGSTTRSLAHHVARIAELDQDVVERAAEVYEKMKQHDLPTTDRRRNDTLKRIFVQLETSRRFDAEQLKLLVREAVLPK